MQYRGWAVAAAALLASCAAPDDHFGSPGDGFLADAAELASTVNWAQAEAVTVEVTEYEFSPATLRFRKGQPYALTLTNTGSKPHRFLAPGYFRAVAAKSLVYPDAEASFPRLEAIALEAQESKTLHFVPVLAGAYQVSCDRPFHATFGMLGRIVIE